MEEKHFGQLGFGFQQSLIKLIIEDKKYGETIIDFLESKYFDNVSFKYIMENIKELYSLYNNIPNYETLIQKIMVENGKSQSATIHVDTLKILQEMELTHHEYVRDTALNFCKQQNLRRELKKVQTIIEEGNFEEYVKIEEIIQTALQVGVQSEEATDVFHDIESALEKDNRHPIPTGIVGIDNVLNGGLGKGELGVVLAPTGTGKTTILTKIANTAYNLGLNVLQIFFEDNKGEIKRKHYTIWSGIPSSEQPFRVNDVINRVEEVKNKSNGSLRLLKLPSDGITISEIKSIMRKMISDGFNIDLLLIDYVDCISPERSNFGEEWKGEGPIMRKLESMTGEFDIAIWTATQGNRESISAEVVTGNQMGGSIKKAQIAHVIVSIAKTLEQKENNLATLTLVKSRVGRDGIIWSNCKFNNEFLEIDTDTQNTLLGFEEERTKENAHRAQELYRKRQEKKEKLIS
jgi:replicative DNA helicase